jgi:uncharacterized protein (TIGR03089 family)
VTDTPAALLRAALRRDPAGPLITYYDDATGERTELSATTMANWVAKTANLLGEETAVGPGESVAVLLPAHWQTAVVLLALWSLGAQPTTEPGSAMVVIADELRLAALAETGSRDVVGLSLAPMNAPLRSAPPGVLDYAAEVLAAGDAFAAGHPSGHEATLTARLRADDVGLTGADRVLVTGAAGAPDAVDWLLAPLVAEASIVLCRNADPRLLPRRVADERITATMGTAVEGARRLD